jgi:hypothetical protein
MAWPVAAQADFGIRAGSVRTSFEISKGLIGLPQASSHPYSFTVGLELNTNSEGKTEGGELRDLVIDLPPGMVGNPLAVPQCSRQEFEGFVPACSSNSQIGIVSAVLPGFFGGVRAAGPLYNLVPPPGVAGELGFSLANLNSLSNASLRNRDEGYGLQVSTNSIPLEVSSLEATIWGVPADEGHDERRGIEPAEERPGSTPFIGPRRAFFTLPASCSEPLKTVVSVDSNTNPGVFVSATAESLNAGGEPSPLPGCGDIPFNPAVAATTTSNQASSASGLNFNLTLPNEGLESTEPGAVAETEPVKTEVTLPLGMTVNPSAAAGQGACPLSQFEPAGGSTPSCPSASKVGTLLADSPLLEEPIEGGVYLAEQGHNPFGSLVAIYFIARAPERGVTIAQAGRVDIDQATGQLTATFDGLPPVPYSSFQLDLREGPRAPLTTPRTCGGYQTIARLYPFSDSGSAALRNAPFNITSGPEGTGCVGSEAQLPNSPTFEAGTQTPLAGMYSPFILKLSRNEASQHLRALNVTLPPGLTGRLAGTGECSDAQIAQAASRSKEGEGALEQASPSCPVTSEIGTVTVGAGSGAPLYVQGHAYLAGPYKGAPLSMAIVTPAIAGPFDLGTVVVRAALYVDESTARITVRSDPLPTSLNGIPLDIRSIAVEIAKKEFTLNPTSCEASSLGAEAVSTTGSVAHLQNRFQVGGCKGLDFEPDLKLAFTGQTKRRGFPAVKAVLSQPKGENANLSGATVILPKGMLIANSHINNPCTRVQFNSTPIPGAGCPPKSILGTAKVWTPLLAQPEEGNVYFRSNGGERKLPDLAVALRGRIPLQLVGFIDSVGKKGAEVRRVRSRFLNLPDAPVSRFELKLSGGKKGLLQNSENLCKAENRAEFQLIGQNGKSHDTEPKVQIACGKGREKKKSK